MIFISKFLVPNGYTGIALFPFVFIKSKHFAKNRVLLNHERIHLRQQLELLVIPFYIFYVLEFAIRLFYYKSRKMAYKNISFEREAYQKECCLEYLDKRPIWAFLKYIRNNGISTSK
ncbi:hypothetical protein GSB9_01364 [Flavobacteriaceae bacterium GSB9]|nr:hypothetical protein GSB9_01364 [Flavobacteriaceae bacterium GSB9]